MPNRKNIILVAIFLGSMSGSMAQSPLTLGECRQRALEANRGLKQAEVKRQQTEALEKVALWQMLPKVSANGGYLWMEKSINLLSDEQKDRLSHMGDNIGADIGLALHRELDDIPLVGNQIATRIDNALGSSNLPAYVNGIGQELVDGLATDTRNMGMATVTLTQPLYMGGKLLAAYRTARLLNAMSGIEYDREREATLIAVDEAYWQVVSVMHKKELAERYASLLDTLEQNVQLAVEAEMSTKGDLAKVRVKRNEAQLSLTKATNGLQLAKMLLAQRCGMPLDTVFDIVLEELAGEAADSLAPVIAMDSVYAHRAEMQMLRIGDSIARQGVRMAAGALKPNIALTGGYLMSNPNLFDGFSNTWGGSWMAGVVVNVPIVHVGGIYALKAAKAKQREARYRMEEAEEMIELQVNKLSHELELANRKLVQCQSALEAAEENLKLADESFKAGVCSSSDLMAAQTAWVQARGEVIDARIEIAMSKVYLRQALGQ